MTKPNRKPARKPGRTKKHSVQFYIGDELLGAFDAFIASRPLDERPKKQAALETALMEYLSKRGHWPTPKE